MQNNCLNRKYNSGCDKYTNLMVESLIAHSTPATAEWRCTWKAHLHTQDHSLSWTLVLPKKQTIFPGGALLLPALLLPFSSKLQPCLLIPTFSCCEVTCCFIGKTEPTQRAFPWDRTSRHMPHASTSAPLGCTSHLRKANSPTLAPGPSLFGLL